MVQLGSQRRRQMQAIALMAMLTLVQAPPQGRGTEVGQRPTTSPLTDGEWTVVCAEMDGKKIEEAKLTKVTVRGNTITWAHDGSQCSAKLEFGANNVLRITDMMKDGK